MSEIHPLTGHVANMPDPTSLTQLRNYWNLVEIDIQLFKDRPRSLHPSTGRNPPRGFWLESERQEVRARQVRAGCRLSNG
jgi:hypothetical protein